MHKIGRTVRRRRKEGKTDYKARLVLLKSNQPRFVVRKSNRYILGQVIESENAQDKVISGVSSKELLNYGWPDTMKGSLKNMTAAYLTGFMLGKKSKIKEGIFDMGLQRNVKRSRIYAFLKGLIDAEIKIPHSKETLPPEEMLLKNEKTGRLINPIKEKLQNGN